MVRSPAVLPPVAPPPAPRRHRVVPTGWSVVENGESRERRTEKVETAVERPTCQKPWSGVVLSKKVVLAKDVFITVWRCQDPFSGLGPLGTFWFFLLVGCSFFPPLVPLSSQQSTWSRICPRSAVGQVGVPTFASLVQVRPNGRGAAPSRKGGEDFPSCGGFCHFVGLLTSGRQTRGPPPQ